MKPSHLIIFDNSYLISSSQKIKTGSLGWLLKKKYFQSNVFLWHILNRFAGKIYSALMLNIQRRSLYLLLLKLFYQFKVKKILIALCSLLPIFSLGHYTLRNYISYLHQLPKQNIWKINTHFSDILSFKLMEIFRVRQIILPKRKYRVNKLFRFFGCEECGFLTNSCFSDFRRGARIIKKLNQSRSPRMIDFRAFVLSTQIDICLLI